MHTHPLETWEQDTIVSTIEITNNIRVRQVRVSCAWCEKKHFVTMEKKQEVSGHMFCGNCGQFFKWYVHDGESVSRRVRARPKLGE